MTQHCDSSIPFRDCTGKDGALKSLAAKNAAAKAEKAKQKMEAARVKEEKAASGPSEAENALQVYLQARQKLGAPKADIKLNSIDLRSLDGSELLLGTDLTLNQGRRYGLIGRNGAGKSTLLREIAYYKFDKFPKNLKVLMVEQEVTGDDRKPIEWVLHSDVERRLLLQEQKLLQDKDARDASESERLKQIADRLQEIGSDDAEPRAAKILRGYLPALPGASSSYLGLMCAHASTWSCSCQDFSSQINCWTRPHLLYLVDGECVCHWRRHFLHNLSCYSWMSQQIIWISQLLLDLAIGYSLFEEPCCVRVCWRRFFTFRITCFRARTPVLLSRMIGAS